MKWLKMDCDAQENLDMRKLVDEWGWEWYGRYWAIAGKIGMLVTEKCQTFALQTNNDRPFPIKLLANDLGTTVERLTEFCNYLSDNRLIDYNAWVEKSLIYMPKLEERADEYTKKLLTKSRHSPDQEVDKKKKEKKKEKDQVEVVFPKSLDVDIFKKAWSDFKQMRSEIKRPLKFTAERTQLNKLSKLSVEIATKMVEQSTENQWQGIFELKGNQNGRTSPSAATAEPGKYDRFSKNGNPKPIPEQIPVESSRIVPRESGVH